MKNYNKNYKCAKQRQVAVKTIRISAFQYDEIEKSEQRDRLDLQEYIKQCREILRLDLYLINPCMRMALEQWIRDYRYLASTGILPLICLLF